MPMSDQSSFPSQICALPARRMAAQARSAAILCPARPEDGGLGTFCGDSVSCPPKGWWSWHVLRLFCAPDAKRMVVQARSAAIMCPACFEDGGLGTFCGDSVSCPPGGWRPWHVLWALCSSPARRMAAQARSAAILCPARPKVGSPGTFSGHYVSRPPGGGWLWHVLQRLCSLRAGGWAVLARSVGIMFPARPGDGGLGTFCGCSVPRTPKGWWP